MQYKNKYNNVRKKLAENNKTCSSNFNRNNCNRYCKKSLT